MASVTIENLPENLYATLLKRAERNHRTLSGEILARLESSVAVEEIDVDDVLAMVDEARSRDHVRLDPSLLEAARTSGRP